MGEEEMGIETAIVYPNRHIRITSNKKLNTGPYIGYRNLQKLIEGGTVFKFFLSTTKADVTDIMLKKISNQVKAYEISLEFYRSAPKAKRKPLKMVNDDSDGYDPFQRRKA